MEEKQEVSPPADGDIYDVEGNIVGEIYLEDLPKLDSIKTGLVLNVLYEGKLHVFKLEGIAEPEAPDAKPVEG